VCGWEKQPQELCLVCFEQAWDDAVAAGEQVSDACVV